ncbi:MAG TPA: lipopolysaccharide biosynthesis protein [Pirellulales bacterium]
MIRRLMTSTSDWFTRLPDGELLDDSIDDSAETPIEEPVGTGEPISHGDLHRRVRQGGLWVLAGRTSGIGLTVIMNVVLARWVLSRDDFGAFVLISSMIGLASTFAMFGLNGAIVPLVSRNLALLNVAAVRRALRLTIIAVLISGGTAALVTPWALRFVTFDFPLTGALPWLIAGCALLLAWQQVGAEALRGFHDQRWANVLSGGQVGGPLTLLLFVSLVAASLLVERPTLTGLVAMLFGSLSCTVLWTGVCMVRDLPHQAMQQHAANGSSMVPTANDLLRLCVPLLLIQLLVFVAAQADVWIAGYYVPAGQLAVYAAARRLILLTAIPLQIAAATVAPSIAELHAHGRITELQTMLRSAAGVASLPAIVALLAVTVAGGLILRLVFGPGYEAGYSVVVILGIGQLIFNWCGVCGTALIMTGHQNVALVATGATSAILVIVGPPLTARFGIQGLAFASALGLSVQNLTIWVLARRYLGIWTHANFSWGRITWKPLRRRSDRAAAVACQQNESSPARWSEECTEV